MVSNYMFDTLNSLSRSLYAYRNSSAPAIRRACRVLTFTQDAVRSAHTKGEATDAEGLEHLVNWAVATVNKATNPRCRVLGRWGGAIHAELLAETENEQGKCHGVEESEVDGCRAYAPFEYSSPASSVPPYSVFNVASQATAEPSQAIGLGISSTSSEVSNHNDRSEINGEVLLLPREMLEMLGEEAVKGFSEETSRWEPVI